MDGQVGEKNCIGSAMIEISAQIKFSSNWAPLDNNHQQRNAPY